MDSGYPGLGFDPAPGDVDAVTGTAEQFTAAADALDGVGPALRQAADVSAGWHGAAADAFRERLGELPAGLAQRRRGLRAAADALSGWARTLAGNQRRAEELDREAVALRRQLESARDDLADKQNAADLASTAGAAAVASIELTAAANRVAGVEEELREVLARASRLDGDHRRAADAAAEALAAAGAGQPPPERSGPRLARLLDGQLDTAAHISAALADLLAPADGGARPPSGAVAALTRALTGPPSSDAVSGELVVLGETPLPHRGAARP